jgi:hypothetical protein
MKSVHRRRSHVLFVRPLLIHTFEIQFGLFLYTILLCIFYSLNCVLSTRKQSNENYSHYISGGLHKSLVFHLEGRLAMLFVSRIELHIKLKLSM